MAALTANTIPKATDGTHIANSLLTEDATTLAYNTNKFTVTAASGNTLIAGTTSFTGKAFPTSDDGAALGDTTHNFSDLFLATGALINFANSNSVITHSSGILTVSTGDLRVVSANVGVNADSVPTLSSTSTLTNKTLTSPVVTTGLTTGSSTFALLNATTTTVNAFGAAATLNIGAAATCILNFGGGATASEFRFLEPSGSGTNFSAFKAVAQGSNITYSLPPTVGGAGTVLTDVAGNGVLTWAAAAGSGTVTVVGAGSLTSTALVTGGGTTTLQTPSATATLDSSGNISTPGAITTGSGSGVAGTFQSLEGTAPSLVANSFQLYSPADVAVGGLAYILPGAAATGFVLATNAAGVMTLSHVASTGSGNVVLGTTPTIATPIITSPQISLTAAHGSDDTYSGTTIAGLNAGATIAQWEAVYLGGSSTWLLADANGSSTYPARGLAVAAYVNTNAAIILTYGTVRNDAWNWTIGTAIYLSGTPGALTQTAPSTSGDKVQVVGFALTADIAFFDFNSTYLTVT